MNMIVCLLLKSGFSNDKSANVKMSACVHEIKVAENLKYSG